MGRVIAKRTRTLWFTYPFYTASIYYLKKKMKSRLYNCYSLLLQPKHQKNTTPSVQEQIKELTRDYSWLINQLDTTNPEHTTLPGMSHQREVDSFFNLDSLLTGMDIKADGDNLTLSRASVPQWMWDMLTTESAADRMVSAWHHLNQVTITVRDARPEDLGLASEQRRTRRPRRTRAGRSFCGGGKEM